MWAMPKIKCGFMGFHPSYNDIPHCMYVSRIIKHSNLFNLFFHFLGDSDIDQLFHIVKCLGDKSHPDAK